jgi:hypothetical protein
MRARRPSTIDERALPALLPGPAEGAQRVDEPPRGVQVLHEGLVASSVRQKEAEVSGFPVSEFRAQPSTVRFVCWAVQQQVPDRLRRVVSAACGQYHK